MGERVEIREVVSTDPGVDDALAILVGWSALDSPAIVATYGNASTMQTGRNLQALYHFEQTHRKPGIQKPSPTVFVGCDRPLGSDVPFEIDIDFIHGSGAMEGLAGMEFIGEKSEGLYRSLSSQGAPIDVYSFGAVTEVLRMIDSPRFSIQSLTFMGGVIAQQGNTDTHQEANLRHDPRVLMDIVRICNENGVPITMVPLDVTEDDGLEFTPERVLALTEGLRRRNSPNIADYILRLIGPESTYSRFYRDLDGIYDLRPRIPVIKKYSGPPIHDLTALYARLHPELFESRTYPIKVAGDGSVAISRDYYGINGYVNVVMALKGGKENRYWKLTEDYLASHYC